MTTDDKPAPEVLKMMADRDLCEPCATRMASLPPGMLGAWICAECSARHAAKDAAEAAARRAQGHPAPWRCVDGGPNGNADRVVDANGDEVIICEDRYESVWFADEGAKALVLAAPEMEALLREEFDDGAHRYCGGTCWDCRRKAVLARIDAAKAR